MVAKSSSTFTIFILNITVHFIMSNSFINLKNFSFSLNFLNTLPCLYAMCIIFFFCLNVIFKFFDYFWSFFAFFHFVYFFIEALVFALFSISEWVFEFFNNFLLALSCLLSSITNTIIFLQLPQENGYFMIIACMNGNLKRLWKKPQVNTTHEKMQAPQNIVQKSLFVQKNKNKSLLCMVDPLLSREFSRHWPTVFS